jgi:hypothetical protein
MKLLLFLLGLILVAVIAVWFGRSGTGSEPGSVAPAPSARAPGGANESAKLESEAAGRKPLTDPAARPAAGETGPATAPAAPQSIDPSVIPAGLDGGMTNTASPTNVVSAFETRYAGASKAELETSYDALKKLYDENVEGRVQDKQRRLSPEGLVELAREVAWLKEKALGGG